MGTSKLVSFYSRVFMDYVSSMDIMVYRLPAEMFCEDPVSLGFPIHDLEAALRKKLLKLFFHLRTL